MIDRRRLLIPTLLFATVFAGCLSADDALPLTRLADGEAPGWQGTFTWPTPVVHDVTGIINGVVPDLDPTGSSFPRYVERLVPGDGAEPNIGVTSAGNIFVTSFDQVHRSGDGGATWEIVHDFVTPNFPETEDLFRTADPMLWVDPVTDRIFANHMHPSILCAYMVWSDDEGETWTERPASCGVPYLDHQKIVTGTPALTGVGPRTYPTNLYFCVNKIELGTWCATSLDGGISYAYDRQVYIHDQSCSNINGHPAVFPDGTVAVALGSLGAYCDRPATVVVSEDDGLTWTLRQCAPEYGQTEIDADITITADGTAYMLFRHTDERAYLLRSTDKFRTCDVFPVAPPDHTINVFAGITHGDDGRIAMAYLGTRDPQEQDAGPSNATGGTRWHLFVTTTFDAASASPTFVTQQVTPEEDPVQLGCVWLQGGGGGPRGCRNLLDFIDVVSDQDGRVHIAITDGCTPRIGCAGDPFRSDFQSRDRQIGVVVQDSGMSLFAAKGVLPSIGLTWPEPLPS